MAIDTIELFGRIGSNRVGDNGVLTVMAKSMITKICKFFQLRLNTPLLLNLGLWDCLLLLIRFVLSALARLIWAALLSYRA